MAREGPPGLPAGDLACAGPGLGILVHVPHVAPHPAPAAQTERGSALRGRVDGSHRVPSGATIAAPDRSETANRGKPAAEVEHAGETITTEVERANEQLEAEAKRQRGLADVEAERASSGKSAPPPRPPVARVRGERDRDRERDR